MLCYTQDDSNAAEGKQTSEKLPNILFVKKLFIRIIALIRQKLTMYESYVKKNYLNLELISLS